MIFYECMILSPIDKMFEFDDEIVFYNMIMNKKDFDEDPLIMRMIRKGCFLVLIINHKGDGTNQMIETIADTFKFKLTKYDYAMQEIIDKRSNTNYNSERKSSEDS